MSQSQGVGRLNPTHLLDESTFTVGVGFSIDATKSSKNALRGPRRTAADPTAIRPMTCNIYISHGGTGLRCGNVSSPPSIEHDPLPPEQRTCAALLYEDNPAQNECCNRARSCQ
jgi:hypothetical protein